MRSEDVRGTAFNYKQMYTAQRLREGVVKLECTSGRLITHGSGMFYFKVRHDSAPELRNLHRLLRTRWYPIPPEVQYVFNEGLGM